MNKCICFDIKNRDLCCGCGNCVDCPVNAITIVKNEEGFVYPKINYELCIDCGKCGKLCPITAKLETNKPYMYFAAQNKNELDLKNSSSGGIFIILAKEIIKQNGVVYGCMYDNNMNVKHIGTTSIDEVIKMQGSKYVASDLNNAYCEVKKYLENNKLVLFTGTPCQIAGLKAYLGKEYSNLYTMDFLCHGTPSQDIFQASIKDFEKKYNGKVVDYKFRDKEIGWGQNSKITIQENNGKLKDIKMVSDFNPYHYGFLQGKLNRYSCYNCQFVGINRMSDITVADFWGVREFHSEFDAQKGVSIYLINTEKGKVLFDKTKEKIKLQESNINNMAKENGALIVEPCQHHIPEERAYIYRDLQTKGYKYVAKTYLTPKMTIKRVVKKYAPFSVQKILRRFL